MTRIDSFWQTYLLSLSERKRPHAHPIDVWTFGDTPDVADICARLVKAGIKTATSQLVWEAESDGDRLPVPGDRAVVADSHGGPHCVIEVTECVVRSFGEVDAQFAFDYGEGDRTLEGWRKDAWAYFAPICERLGREADETMPLVCQRFRSIYPKLER